MDRSGCLTTGTLECEDFGAVRCRVDEYYADRIARHGATPLGVDWSCAPTQELRFVQLLRLCDFGHAFSLNDLGCGYGALLGFLGRRHRGKRVDYLGIDLCPAMIEAAQVLWAKRRQARFVHAELPTRRADYTLASGIFNVRLSSSDDEWTRFIELTLDQMHASSRLCFGVNFLARLPAGSFSPPQLYRTDARRWQSYCQKRYGIKGQVIRG